MTRYLLVVVTHGASPDLPAALAAFRYYAAPRPVAGLLYIDGPDVDDAAYAAAAAHGIHDWTLTGSSEQRGFCVTYADAWQEAVEVAQQHDCGHVFWLESDFLLTRPVELEALAHLLDTEPMLAQVALMRQACNDLEAAAGGLYESRPGEYEPRSVFTEEPIPSGVRLRAYPWLRHTSYVTTNPSLMRRDFMEAHPWPDYPSRCEGRFGIDLVGSGYSFGVWGEGSPWCDHVGVRTGKGY